MLRSKKGHNKISPKTEEQVKPKRKKIQSKPKTIGTENPWESKRNAQRILKPRKERSTQQETTAKYKKAKDPQE